MIYFSMIELRFKVIKGRGHRERIWIKILDDWISRSNHPVRRLYKHFSSDSVKPSEAEIVFTAE